MTAWYSGISTGTSSGSPLNRSRIGRREDCSCATSRPGNRNTSVRATSSSPWTAFACGRTRSRRCSSTALSTRPCASRSGATTNTSTSRGRSAPIITASTPSKTRRWDAGEVRCREKFMKRIAIAFVVFAAIGLSAQQPPAPPPQISAFFNEFTTEWVRGNPNQAANTRYFTGAEQDAFEQQITPQTAEYRRGRVELAKKGLERLATFDRARLSETERISADLMQWQLGVVVEAEKYSDYFF